MWALLVLLFLLPPGSSATGALAEMRQTPPPAGTGARAQPPSAAQGALPKAPLTASELPARGADPLLSLNLGLNFKIKVKSQGSFRPAGPSAEPALADLPSAEMAEPISSASFLTPGKALSGSSSAPGSGWLVTGSADEPSPDASHSPGSWGETAADWDGSPVPRFRSSPRGRPPSTTPLESEFLEPVPAARLSSFRPDVMLPAARQPTPASSPRGRSQGLSFHINIDLTAGLDQEMGAPPTHVLPARGGKGPGTRWKFPLLPSLKAGISEIASKLGTSSFFGPTLPPDWHQERNSTGGVWEQPQDTSPSPPRATEPGAGSGCSSAPGAASREMLGGSLSAQAAAGQPWNPGPGLESRRGVAQSGRGDMDVAAKPHIPPAMALYAEKHGVFQLMQSVVEALLIHQPEDPISFMIDHLKQDSDHVPRVFVLGPPAAGKTTIAMWLCKHLSASYLSQQKLLSNKTLELAKEAQSYQQRQEQIPDELWVGLLQDRLLDVDCVREGWVLDGFPQTREQAVLLQTSGIVPRHVVALYAPDTVLVERNLGKRLDPVSAEVYHTTFDWPADPTVEQRLVQPNGCSEQATAKRLLEYHRNIQGIFQSYRGNLRTVNADQPCADVFSQVLTFVESQPRSAAPFTPRVLLCGPPGSGKSLQAALLAQKYGLVNVGCGQLLKEAVAEKSKIGELIKPYFESGCPVADNLVLKVLRERLGKLDCAAFGWVLHGFPRDADQAELLRNTGFIPNRVFFLTLPVEAILERVSQRATDPVTGERYHHLYKPAPSLELRRRLRQKPQDAAEKLELRVDLYGRHVADLEEFYEDAVYINADQDPYTVFESIESCLTRPLPRHTV